MDKGKKFINNLFELIYKKKSIRSKIFLSYSCIFIILILFSASLYFFTSYENFLKGQASTSRHLSKIMSREIDQYIDYINQIQIRILESDDILEYIFEDAKLDNAIDDRRFRDDIFTITGYDFDFYHMNILNFSDDILITFGQEYYVKPYEVDPYIYDKFVKPTVSLNGAKNIIPTDMGNIYTPNLNSHTFSISRAFSRYSLSPAKAIIEIQINMQRIEEIISSNLYSFGTAGEKVLIFDNNKNLIYPIDFDNDLFNYYSELNTDSEYLFKNPYTHKTEIITSYYSKNTKFITLLITPESYIAKNKLFYLRTGLIFCLLTFAFLTFLSYRVAKSITNPLEDLKTKISTLALDEISDTPSHIEGYKSKNEFEILNESYNHMQNRLKNSLDTIVASKTLTIHSQIMALQAQMDSHFLYNTLTIISIVAEENDDLDASIMCVKLTEMLRYITIDHSKLTNFNDEIKHTTNYTDLMTIRFGNKIKFDYDTDVNLNSIEIPRLIIQPIVENCVKYSRNDKKALNISIRTFTKDNFWYIEIKDNGYGFSDDALSKIDKKVKLLDKNKNYTNVDFSGLGLANIYLRLKLLYMDDFVFSIKNIQENNEIIGASITIGGLNKNGK